MTSTVAIINWNSGRWLRTCIESLLATTTMAEILVIDNASSDASIESVQGFRDRVDFVRNSVNRGFAAAVNQAFQATTSSYILILNPDVRAMPGAVQLLEDFMNANPRAAAVGGYVGEKYLPKALPSVGALIRENFGFPVAGEKGRGKMGSDPSRETGLISITGIPVRERGQTPFSPAPFPPPLQVDQPAAAALMIRRDAYDEVGGFDEQFYPAWYEDVDFCQRLKANQWEIYFVAHAEFLHEGGYSAEAMGSQSFLRSYYGNQLRYARKHFGALGGFAVGVSVAVGMLGRMIVRPRQAAAYAQALVAVFRGQ
jgi:GT2 family glycosyltransferase